MARPIQGSERKARVLHIRVTPQELESIEKASAYANLKPSEYVRAKLLAVSASVIQQPQECVSVSPSPSLPLQPLLKEKKAFEGINQQKAISERFQGRKTDPSRTLRGTRAKEKPKKTKGISRCSHGFLTLDGKTSCPQCA